MDTTVLLNAKEHPEYEEIITEVLNKKFDLKLMDKALSYAKRESQAEAYYVLLKLSQKLPK